jgi:hypothetical protein
VLAGGLVPDDGRLALVRDAYGGDLGALVAFGLKVLGGFLDALFD